MFTLWCSGEMKHAGNKMLTISEVLIKLQLLTLDVAKII